MTDKFDTDDPHEVVAVAQKFRTAINTVGSQVGQISGDFVVPRRPESEIDRRLTAHTQWMKTTFERAVRANGRRVDATTEVTTQVTYTHGDADRAGAAAVRRRAESV
ncbi:MULTISPECIES: hypothetical protein [Nocardia]|uniref:PE domain-containing protein n=1 Tax=Nocardia implantans TaxID=3108168 RepID=A0ABU6AQ22_9NOCA|nr:MULTISPECIES: hypothetical protein [unclassified Nocardia]MBF6189785.1 hypothetical protein [Nocardia beijingensis]MEA3526984.1 hypothetical protein [Nocardia sp. CDC192]MEB3509438.1 hypothetical protein [Nocardia sp. CDC186]